MKQVLFQSFMFKLALLFFCSSAVAGDVKGIRFWQDPEKTRLVFDVSEQVDYKLFTLEDPYRLVVDLQNAKLKTEIDTVDVPQALVKKVRASQSSDKLRVVLDLKRGVSTKDFLLKPYQDYGHRLVIDIRDKNAQKPVVKTASSVIKEKNRDIIIAIDAGHGGEDPGASGKKGTREKNVTLAVAKRLAEKINAQKGYKAFLTRSGDYYVGLEERTRLARNNRADLLVSLHADGFTDSRVKGASVWVLSTRGANSEMGKWLEQREKSSDLLGGVESLQNKDPLVAKVLIDLSMHYSIGESLKAGEEVRKKLASSMPKMHGKGLRKAAFVVLKMPDIPAMLVEMAFISNPEEERLLRTSSQQNKIANAVFSGVQKYFRANAPDGTYIASLGQERSHKVKRGDTLSEIAASYGVSMNQLKKHNKLTSSNLRIGQVLSIPEV
ncbi:N-acetylmuramoyl-L-alanine amidase [Aliikangiella sp. G2MR2-5]|uniref:N-acetylmuramoyl-L-alanine amidase n=1 Tax=Aliikangiella sp. G2MR2-5 TaxID=2788943 RepID=UPI0018A943E0|nr:N-acetylmuramoyl-L-alanine amidase [Aliikangiella sp. G2MR2-5]